MNVYVDESGDLGFVHDKPFREGGSSRYLTITHLLIPKKISHLPARIIRNIYIQRKRSSNNELKGSELNPKDRHAFSEQVVDLLRTYPEIKIFSITVNKENVEDHIRQDANKLYNYMIGLILPDYIKAFALITLIPDQRSIRVSSGDSLADYLKMKLIFELKSGTKINNKPHESHKDLNLQFVDFISHIIWGRYEDGENDDSYKILSFHISERHLFFDRITN